MALALLVQPLYMQPSQCMYSKESGLASDTPTIPFSRQPAATQHLHLYELHKLTLLTPLLTLWSQQK